MLPALADCCGRGSDRDRVLFCQLNRDRADTSGWWNVAGVIIRRCVPAGIHGRTQSNLPGCEMAGIGSDIAHGVLAHDASMVGVVLFLYVAHCLDRMDARLDSAEVA